MLAMPDLHRPLRCPLPEQLTPAHVHALLSDLRLSASQVTVLSAEGGYPHEHEARWLAPRFGIPSQNYCTVLYRVLGQKPAYPKLSSYPVVAAERLASVAQPLLLTSCCFHQETGLGLDICC